MHVTKTTFHCLANNWESSPRTRPLLILAGIVAVVALPLLLTADAFRYAYFVYHGFPKKEFHSFFNTPIYSSYVSQLKEFIKKDPSEHETFVREFRQLYNEKDLDYQTRASIEKLGHWIYTGAHILPYMNEWIKAQSIMPKGSASEQMEILYNNLGNQERFRQEEPPSYRQYDARMLGDTPSSFYSLHNTKIIRMPAPTRDGNRGLFGIMHSAEIVEEFKAHLDYCQKNNETHFYVNLMHRDGNEGLRTHAIEELEKQYDHFSLLTLSKNCSFYNQFRSYPSAQEFKEDFLEQLLNDKKNYHIPIRHDLEDTKALIQKALDRVHCIYFKAKNDLTREERKIFIDLAYAEIIEAMIKTYQPTTCNLSCKSCIDRGASSLALLYAKAHSSVDQETLISMALAPAMITSNRMMQQAHMTRLLEALKFLERERQ